MATALFIVQILENFAYNLERRKNPDNRIY